MQLRLLILAALLVCCAGRANAACSGSSPNFTAASASQADITACVSALTANTPSTILVPANAGVSYSSAVDLPNNVCVTVNGQGAVTITSNLAFTLEPSNSCETRITGFTFTGASGNPPNCDINISSSIGDGTSTYRIDHNTFTDLASAIFVCAAGGGPGLIDHNTFNVSGAAEDIHNLGYGTGSSTGWTNSVIPGSLNALYIETNTFNNSDPTFICSITEGYYGSRTVVRYNTMNFCQVDQHGTSGAVGARWFEVYDNTFNNLNQNQCCVVTIRGGSGVIWGNTHVGNNASDPQSIAIYYDGSGGSNTWPASWQPGSGIGGNANPHGSCAGGTLNSAPIQLWGNDTFWNPIQLSVSGVAGQVVLNRDVFTTTSATIPNPISWEEQSGDTCSTTYTYAPAVYPHPLVSGSTGSGIGGGVKLTGGTTVQ
jgi:hypothetical protein